MRVAVILLVAILAVGCFAQEYPSNRPPCNPDTCEGCGPFQPKGTNPLSLVCGDDDVYFPIPVSIVQNDTSVGQELTTTAWVCVACCTAGCGFSPPGAQCNIRQYNYKPDANNKYGCTNCSGPKVESPDGGSIKTYFKYQSTDAVYKVENMPYTTCVDAPPSPIPSPPLPAPAPSPAPMPSTSPVPVPAASPSPTPMSSPPAAAPTPSPAAVSPSPAPGPEASPSPTPMASPPQIIVSTAPPPPSAAARVSAVVGAVAVVAATAMLMA